MLHVFVETNWVVDYVAPRHRQKPAALSLLEKAGRRELKLHLPVLCITEARKVIVTKFQARKEADLIREYVRWARLNGELTAGDGDVVMKTLEKYENRVRAEVADLDTRLAALRHVTGLEVFALDEAQLQRAIDIGFTMDLGPFDQSVLAAVLGRADAIRAREPTAELAFCELDSDLQPWDKQRASREELKELYDCRGIWVYSDFDMIGPERPPNWPSKQGAGTPTTPPR